MILALSLPLFSTNLLDPSQVAVSGAESLIGWAQSACPSRRDHRSRLALGDGLITIHIIVAAIAGHLLDLAADLGQ